MTLEEAINKIDGKNCVLFAGSGFSYGAKGNKGKLTTASALTKEMYEYTLGSNEPDGNLEDAAEQFVKSKGEYGLIEFLKDKFTVFEITDSQEYIGSLPWLRVYTTNYDNVLDFAFNKNRKRLENVYLSRRLRDYKEKTRLCIHLNGTVDNLTTETLNNEFKLTTASYLTDDFIENEWVNLFISDLHTADAIFFIGYSMNFDLDIQRIVRNSVEQNEMKSKCFFIVSENESKYNLRRIEKFGQACNMGLDKFVELVKTREPFDESLYTKAFYCFKKPTKGNVIQSVTAQEALDLYVKGDIKPNHILSSLFQPHDYHYLVKREIVDSIVSDIENGARQILIESNAGNGKTCCLESLACLLVSKGFDVYSYTRSYESLKSEIETICSSENKTVFVVDGFSHARAMLSELELFRTDQIVVAADRTLSCDVSYEWLSKKFGEFDTYDIDCLSENELHQIVEIFNHYGFFGEKAALRDDLKIKYLRERCNRTMRDILLDFLNSETIRNRFSEIVSSIKNKNSYYDAFILMLVSPIFNFKLDFNQLAFIFNKRNFTSPAFYNNPSICEFIDKKDSEIRIKSSILAECILSEVLDSQIVVDVLVKVFKELDKYRSNEEYKSILRSLVSYQNLKRVLNVHGSDFSTNITRFFDEIGRTKFCSGNHHYWLQYAIARLFEQDYPRALKYFENAYSFAKKKQETNGGGNYTYQIDNHFARYLLENEMENGTAEKCMKAFSKAHSLLINPKNKEIVRFYTYRVARNYYRFYTTFYAKMSETDKHAFLKACEEMYHRTVWYLQSNDSSFSRKNEARLAKEEMMLIFKETGYELKA